MGWGGVIRVMAKRKGVFLGDLPSYRYFPKSPEHCDEIFKLVFFDLIKKERVKGEGVNAGSEDCRVRC